MGKYIVIGASGDIGRQITHDLLDNGHEVIAQYFNTSLSDLQASFKDRAVSFLKLDLCKPLLQNPFEPWMINHVDGLIYAAGRSYFAELKDVSNEAIDEQYHIHFFNLIKCVQYTSSGLLQGSRGRIVVISSIWGETGSSIESVYSGFKAAQIGFIKSIAKEYAQTNVTANIIAPGIVEGRMTEALGSDVTAVIEQIPQQTLVKPYEISFAVLQLLDMHAQSVTGTVMRINGGWYI